MEASSIDLALKGLWDKARRATEIIARLRVENSQLQSDMELLQQELGRLKNDLAAKEERIRKLDLEKVQAAQNSTFSNGEREALSAKVKELLGKIDSYL